MVFTHLSDLFCYFVTFSVMGEEEKTTCEIVGLCFSVLFNVLAEDRVKGGCCTVEAGDSGV